MIRSLLPVLLLFAPLQATANVYANSDSTPVVIACFQQGNNPLAGLQDAVRILHFNVMNEQQVYNNDSLWASNGSCHVVDSDRRFVRTATEARQQGVWGWHMVGDVVWVVVPRSGRNDSWIVRLEHIGYPAQSYELNRPGQAPRIIDATDDVAWRPTHIFDSKEWRFPVCWRDHRPRSMQTNIPNVKIRIIEQSAGYDTGCDTIVQR